MSYSLTELAAAGPPRLLSGIPDQAAWAAKRAKLKRLWLDSIGELPERAPVQYRIIAEERLNGMSRLHLVYDAAYGDQVTAYLLLPDGASASRPRPAILALHPTANNGKADIADEQGRDNRRYALELAARGYVVLAPDTIAAGERVYPGAEPFHTASFYERFPGWNAIGKMISDHMHGVDLLCGLPEADGDRIGAIGHSLGGYNSLFLAGLDDRIQAIATSCGFSVFAGDPDPNRWGRRPWFSHLPRLTPDIESGTVPFDWNEIAALAAPVPWFCWMGQQDRIFPHWRHIAAAMDDMDELYRFLDAAVSLTLLMGNSGHDFPPAIRQEAYRFLDTALSWQVPAK